MEFLLIQSNSGNQVPEPDPNPWHLDGLPEPDPEPWHLDGLPEPDPEPWHLSQDPDIGDEPDFGPDVEPDLPPDFGPGSKSPDQDEQPPRDAQQLLKLGSLSLTLLLASTPGQGRFDMTLIRDWYGYFCCSFAGQALRTVSTPQQR